MSNAKLPIPPTQALLFVCSLILSCDPAVISPPSATTGAEHQLYLVLFKNYSPDSRPVRNASQPVVVTCRLSLNQLLDLDEKNQILTTSIWVHEEWTDEMLTWSPQNFQGQDVIVVPASSIWLPDIFIFNTADSDMNGFVSSNDSRVVIQWDGLVKWVVPLMVSSVCSVDVTFFPYDRQTCDIQLGSWAYSTDQLTLVSPTTAVDLNQYIMNSEYHLEHVSVSSGTQDSSCCPGDGQRSRVRLRLELARKSLYYDYIVIGPTLMLCVLTLASFFLPCHRGDKIAIGLTVFLTLYVLQLRIADNVPDTNSTPVLGIFLLIVMTFNCVSLIMATIVMNIKQGGSDRPCRAPPTWLLTACQNLLGRLVCTRYTGKDPLMPAGNTNCNQFSSTTNTSSKGKATRVRRAHVSGRSQDPGLELELDPLMNTDPKTGGEASAAVQTPGQHVLNTRFAFGCAPRGVSRRMNIEETTLENANVTLDVKHETDRSENPHRDFFKSEDAHGRTKSDANVHEDTQFEENIPGDKHNYKNVYRDAPIKENVHSNTTMSERGQRNPRLSKIAHRIAKTPENIQGDTTSVDETDESVFFTIKRQWFYVAETVDRCLCLVYSVLLAVSIFTVLFLIPVYCRQDTVK